MSWARRIKKASDVVKQGDTVEAGPTADIKPGNALPLRNIPTGTTVHNIELRPGGGAKIARSAGTSVQLVAKEGKLATLRLPSGEVRLVPLDCRATVGVLSNAEHQNVTIGKAGRSRWFSRRRSLMVDSRVVTRRRIEPTRTP